MLTTFLVGCAGYRLGPVGGAIAGERSIQVGLVVNGTDEPQLSTTVSHALRARIQQDGTFRLSTHGDADVVVSIALNKYQRMALTFQPNDVISVRDYDVFLVARVEAVERSSGKKLIDQEIRGRTTIRSNPDLGSAERESAPLLADSLARNIISLLAEGSW
jgi:hypothetical protein